ncbi:MAG TPA: FAD-dependent oxidoreductase, partial [Rhodobacteraceae bacterium]|nr:FAD-dependent oxidoreductase [Paracoccaceae bacterium]
LQQYYFEDYLVRHIRKLQAGGKPIEIRGKNRLTSLEHHSDHTTLTIDTPDGPYRLKTDWLVACDGPRSTVRELLGLEFEGHVFEDNFLISDVIMTADFPTERWFWFDPPFNRGQSALLHKQPDDVWRIDFQLGWNIDREEVVRPDNVIPRVRAMLGPDTPFELEWVSVYTFQCRSMRSYRHGRILFAGDSAHQVSPFGARGANSGLQDAENLAWKLSLVINKLAPPDLLDSYDRERVPAARENILNSTRSTDFITPKTPLSRLFRDAVLDLAAHVPFARALINTGRLSVPAVYDNSPLNGADDDQLPAATRPGATLVDLPLPAQHGGWLSKRLGGRFQLVAINAPAVTARALTPGDLFHCLDVELISLTTEDAPLLRERYLAEADSAIYLFRPDQHIAARWTAFDPQAIDAALARASGQTSKTMEPAP